MHHFIVFLSLTLLMGISCVFFFATSYAIASWGFRHSAPKYWKRVQSRARVRNLFCVLGLISGVVYVFLAPSLNLVDMYAMTACYTLHIFLGYILAWKAHTREANRASASQGTGL